MLATINLQPVEFTEGETILEVARRTGTFIPTLCEFAALNHRPGTCRMCLVEVTRADGTSRVVTACETRLVEGDAVDTYSHKVRRMQKLQAELLFSDHCETCSGCARHGACELQKVARVVGLDVTRLSGRLATRPVETDASANGLVFTPDKCIRCLRCIEACRQVQGIGVIKLDHTGTNAAVSFGGPWGESETCIQCGQCALVCPTGALAVKDQTDCALDWCSLMSWEEVLLPTMVFPLPGLSWNICHVGIAAGGGTVIDASSSNGRVVHRGLTQWWANNFICAWRIF